MTPDAPTARPSGTRARRRAEVEGQVLRVAREHLARHGAAALSLRAIARDLGMVSSGVYRYVESRDELLTRLIIDAYTSLAQNVAAAHDAVDRSDLDARWSAVGHALRAWAVAHPHDFALIYGSPVPDYEAPAERTTGPGTAVPMLLIQLLSDADAAGRLAPGAGPEAARAVGPLLADEAFAAVSLPPEVLFNGLAAWTLLLGTVTSEVFEQLGRDAFADPEMYFDAMLETARRLVLAP